MNKEQLQQTAPQPEVSSTGLAGVKDFHRSEGRAYYTPMTVFQTADEVVETFQQLEQEALDPSLRLFSKEKESARRRSVLRGRCTREAATELATNPTVPLEVCYPLNYVLPDTTDYIIMLGRNVHTSPVPEWPTVYEYWKQPVELRLSPVERVKRLDPGYRLTCSLRPQDIDELTAIWKPFGWSKEGVTNFISGFSENTQVWFSGVRDLQGKLVSAAMGERLDFAGVTLVEGTEYGTLPEHEGRGLCTVNIIALHAQILDDLLYQQGITPVITSEFDLASRSDMVGRKTGMTIPMVEGRGGLEQTPLQVLKYNVSVLDRQIPNTINWRDLGTRRHHFRESYRTTYRYWRNFLVGILPRASIAHYYSKETVTSILESAYAHPDQ